ncbi:hypothetical protein GCM10011628_14130 [Lactobacillus acetotolerans DSM 20749 = JCM 3825]|nr:hypothetical protein GCM10011628_14130 [Lactobacillus acetotolerans DSM 20749 = JCM 3825]
MLIAPTAEIPVIVIAAAAVNLTTLLLISKSNSPNILNAVAKIEKATILLTFLYHSTLHMLLALCYIIITIMILVRKKRLKQIVLDVSLIYRKNQILFKF